MSEQEILDAEKALDDAKARHAAKVNEFPKWIEPDPSHVEGGVAPLFSESHIDRVTNKIKVLVSTAEEEAKALVAKVLPQTEKPAESTETKSKI